MPRPKNALKLDGSKIKSLRKSMDLTQEAFVALDAVEMSLSAFQGIERGKAASRDHAYQIAQVFDVALEELIESGPIIDENAISQIYTFEIRDKLRIYPSKFVNTVFICNGVTEIGQASGDRFIVENDLRLINFLGIDVVSALRFQFKNHSGLVIHRVHCDRSLADQVLQIADGGLKYGFQSIHEKFQPLSFRVLFLGRVLEMSTGFVDDPNQREIATIWRLVGIDRRG